MTIPSKSRLFKAAADVVESGDLDNIFGDWMQTFPDITEDEGGEAESLATKVQEEIVTMLRASGRGKITEGGTLRKAAGIVQQLRLEGMEPLVKALGEIADILDRQKRKA